MIINEENLVKEYADKCNKLNLIYKEINNALYFDDMKPRNFYNLIWEIARILERENDELGTHFIEDTDRCF